MTKTCISQELAHFFQNDPVTVRVKARETRKRPKKTPEKGKSRKYFGRGAARGPNAVLKKLKMVTSRSLLVFWGGKKKTFPPQRNNKSEVEKVQIPRTYTGRWLSPYHRDRVLDTIFFCEAISCRSLMPPLCFLPRITQHSHGQMFWQMFSGCRPSYQ